MGDPFFHPLQHPVSTGTKTLTKFGSFLRMDETDFDSGDEADVPRRARRYETEAYQCNPRVFWVFALGMVLIMLGGILNIVGEVTAAVAGVARM